MKDFPHVIRKIGFFTFCKRVWAQIGEDNVFTWASALAYSWLFAIFPFLVFLLSLVPLIPHQNKQQVEKQINAAIDRALPSTDAGKIIKEKIEDVLKAPNTGGFLSFGLLLTAWASSGGMAMTMSALDKAYDIEVGRNFFKHRLIALLLTVVVATMAVAVLILLPVGTAVLHYARIHSAWAGQWFWLWYILFNVVRFGIALLLMISITAMIYHFGPNLKHKFQAVSPGAIFSILGWLATGIGFRIYINSFGGEASYTKTYGAVAGLVILLLFFYVDSLVLLIGAEINSELDFAVMGIPSGPSPAEKTTAKISSPKNEALAKEILDNRDATLQKLEETKN